MLLILPRIKHQIKLWVGTFLGKYLFKQYARGKGPASRFISVFCDEAKTIWINANILVTPVPVKKSIPDYSLDRAIEKEYQKLLLYGDDFTSTAGIFSANNVDVSFPTGMHQVGNRILKEMMPVPYLITNPKYHYGLQSMRFKRKQNMDEGVLLSMPFHHNFYHWMIEILPRLILYDRAPHLQHVPLIVPKSAPAFVKESLKMAGYQSKTVFLEDGVYRFSTLHMLSLLSPMLDVSAVAVDWLNEKFADTVSTITTPKLIYVSRRDAKIRFVSNEIQIDDLLAEFGFETLVMADLSLADQIKVFCNAQCIIGPHGAAFANLAFSKPGSIFIEFFSKGHYSRSYSRIATIRMLKYGFLVGEPTAMGGFSISPDDLRALLSRALHSQS
jgi:Glycosyltransferase 61